VRARRDSRSWIGEKHAAHTGNDAQPSEFELLPIRPTDIRPQQVDTRGDQKANSFLWSRGPDTLVISHSDDIRSDDLDF